MTILATLETEGAHALSAVEHAAGWLVGMSVAAKQDVAALEASDPLVAAAVTAGIGVAEKHGVPVAAAETTAADVLALAKAIASPPVADPAPAAAP